MFCESNESMSYESSVNESTGRIRGVFLYYLMHPKKQMDNEDQVIFFS